MYRKFVLLFSIAFAIQAHAQAPGGPPPGFFPQEMKNIGHLWIEFCFLGSHICTDQEAKIWGQVCVSSLAAWVAIDPVTADAPVGAHYAGWRCGKNGALITPERQGFYNDGVFMESEAK